MVAHQGDHSAGSDGVQGHSQSCHALQVLVLSSLEEHLVAQEVGALIDHEAATLHPAGLAATQKSGQLGAVVQALVGAALEVLLLEKDDLKSENRDVVALPMKEMQHCVFTLPMVMV